MNLDNRIAVRGLCSQVWVYVRKGCPYRFTQKNASESPEPTLTTEVDATDDIDGAIRIFVQIPSDIFGGVERGMTWKEKILHC